ncbi:MAG TPA: hypothetical protein VFB34_11250 [Chloroflexota bacterium]|nr:hypothetical protein [Chloroflexota bacterium]
MTGEWAIGLESWIIQDSNYPDFECGQQAKFAVEFSFDDLTLEEHTRPSSELIRGYAYLLTARVEGVWDKAWVIDCGISVVEAAAPPKGVEAGDLITGRALLGIDPYEYAGYLHDLPGMPPLIYTWRINRISRETTPRVEVAPRVWQRDHKRVAYVDVERTDAWHDDDGRASYVLHCELLDVPPARN